MIQELWRVFPRLLEQNINGLLDGAEPNPTKAFQLYRACKNEDLWKGSFETFSRHLQQFFSRPKAYRRKSDFDRYLDRPMDQVVYSGFYLNFRTALVSQSALQDVASWAHNLMRVCRKSTNAVISLDVMTQTLRRITNPSPFEKAQDIEFADFCTAWKQTVFRLFGSKHDNEFKEILKELHAINAQIKDSEEKAEETPLFTAIYLTQTEIDWTIAIRKAVIDEAPVPKFPLSRGPQKPRLIELERVAALYRMVQSSRWPELAKHRESIRATLLDRCERLLKEKAS